MAKRWLARVREQKSIVLRRSLIVLLSLVAFVGLWYQLPIIFPGGWGIGKDKSVTTESVEFVSKDAQGNITKTVKTTKYDEGKTLWDWLSLIGVPVSLAVLSLRFQWIQRERDEKLAKEQREIAADETKEEVLKDYFDRLSESLLEKNLLAIASKVYAKETQEEEGHPKIEATLEERELLDSSVDVMRARTLSVLRRFENDTERKNSVIRFLLEAEIISKLKLSLRGCDLSGADLYYPELSGANLSGANLSGANLSGANLSFANLSFANLSDANLSGANLSFANLSGANLIRAKLRNADLHVADLYGADLRNADLSGAKLKGTNLNETKFGAKLNGAKFRNNAGLSSRDKAKMIEREAIFEDSLESDVPSVLQR